MGLIDLLGETVSDPFSSAGTIIGAAANPYGVPSAGDWHLTEGSFFVPSTLDRVTFFFETAKGDSSTQKTGLEQIADCGGRRKIAYEYPYRDGQALGDAGRRGGRFSFNLKFFGQDYQTLFQKFLKVVVNNPASGILTHPVLGNIPCGFSDYEFVHRYDERNCVTIRATFLEDNFGDLTATNLTVPSPNSSLRAALQMLTDAQATVGLAISDVSAALKIPGAIRASLQARLDSIVGSLSGLLGQLAATFSTDSHLQSLAAKGQSTLGSVAGSGSSSTQLLSVNAGVDASTGQTLPPVFQVGFSPSDQAAQVALTSGFVSANQITPTQAVYQMNLIRAQVSAAITDAETTLGSPGSEIALSYRALAVQFQQTVENCISQSSASVRIYTVPFVMSARMAAFENGLSVDRQNDIAELNPSLDCLNLIPKGTLLVVPAV